jgi:MFS family permease
MASWEEFLNYPKGATLGLYTATLYLPSIITAYLGDYMSQRFGRKVGVALGSFLVLAGSLINALAVNPGMWVAGKRLDPL